MHFFKKTVCSFLALNTSVFAAENTVSQEEILQKFRHAARNYEGKKIEIGHNQGVKELPQDLGCFNEVVSFVIKDNPLICGISPSIAQLTHLKILSITSTKLNGVIPPEIGNLSVLQSLDLSNNQITGVIPETINGLTYLTTLSLQNNYLSGSIPASLGQLKFLKELRLNNNELTGNIPEDLGQLKRLVDLNLSNNCLSGSIPLALDGLIALEKIDFSSNMLEGEIPPCFADLNLSTCNLSANYFSPSLAWLHCFPNVKKIEGFEVKHSSKDKNTFTACIEHLFRSSSEKLCIFLNKHHKKIVALEVFYNRNPIIATLEYRSNNGAPQMIVKEINPQHKKAAYKGADRSDEEILTEFCEQITEQLSKISRVKNAYNRIEELCLS